MPNVYDRAVCVTELNTRSEIPRKIEGGRMHALQFEVPNDQPRVDASALKYEIDTSSLSETSSGNATPSDVKRDKARDDISNLDEYL